MGVGARLRGGGFSPALWLGSFVLLAIAGGLGRFGDSALGQWLGELVGAAPDGAPLLRDGLAGLALAILCVAAAALLKPLSFRAQVVGSWILLLLLFGLFAYGFDLKWSLIQAKLPFLIGYRLTPNGFLQGAAMTLFLWATSGACMFLLGLAAALSRLSANGVLFGFATFYTSFFRGTPLLLQVVLIYSGLPAIGIVMDAVPAGILALSLNYGAYQAEIFRSGILAIDKGQWEAGTALGLKRPVVLWKIVLPQAMRVIVPPTGNQLVALMKDTSLVSAMGVWELLYLARSYGRSEFRIMEMLLTAAVLYWIMSMMLELAQARAERHYGKGFARGEAADPRPAQVPLVRSTVD